MNNYKRKIGLALLLSVVVHFYFSLPSPLFNVPYSKILFDSQGSILSVKIAKDEQWRLPLHEELPEKYKECLISFEDEYFYNHLGVNPISLIRAFKQNISSGKVKSGGSTISMQVIRLSKKNPYRTFWEKAKEIYQATRLEFGYSKKEILNLYASHAPFGGNIVGISAASWKYFGRPLKELSWSEAAMLAVLPNSPSLIFPGKNTHLLEKKRNRLLKKLERKKIIDSTTYSLAIDEPLPSHFLSFPNNAPHALEFVSKNKKVNLFHSNISENLQIRSAEILNHYSSQYSQNHIYNGAVLVVDNRNNQVISYVGNSNPIDNQIHENYVDIVQSKRSTGSILKPFLHASALDEGLILNQTILPDIPTIIQGFAPKNYTKTYEGAVMASKALSRSLNVPAVRLLQQYGYPRFHTQLKKLGMTSLSNSADHYGLSLILGGSEVSLWDLASMYSGMVKTLNSFEKAPLNKPYTFSDYSPPLILKNSNNQDKKFSKSTVLHASSIYQTFEALLELKRPVNEGNWKLFENSKKIAWKTGTSYGLRDAWALGVTPHYTVAVWIGNATGIGRPGLVGVEKAAPIMFSIFNLLPNEGWFTPPSREMVETTICRSSGKKASSNCEILDTISIGISGQKMATCDYCQTVQLNSKGERVNSSCCLVSEMDSKHYFVLPPVQEWYFKQKSANYEPLPPFNTSCKGIDQENSIEFIYPRHNAKIYIPKELNGNRSQLICEATQSNLSKTLYWHLDNLFLGETTAPHQMPIEYAKGWHVLTIINQSGSERRIRFEIL